MSELRKRNVAFSKETKEGDEDPALIVPPGKGNDEGRSSTITTNGSLRVTKNVKTTTTTPIIDRILQAYVKFTTSASNQDKILKVVQYSLWILSRFYNKNSSSSGLVQLSGKISWARYVNRFLGLPAALEGVRSGSFGNPKSLGKAMAWAMIFYYPLEHISYLKWQAPKLMTSKRKRLAEQASALSCQCWLAYIVLDIVRSSLALKKEGVSLISSSSSPDESSTTIRNERLQMIRNALFAFPAVHWSLPNWDTDPLLSDTSVNFLMWLESLVCMYQGVVNFN